MDIMYWWTRPSRLTLFILIPIYLVCVMMDESEYFSYAQTQKYLIDTTAFLGFLGLGVFAIGAWIGEPRRASIRQWPVFSAHALRTALRLLYALVFLAYAIFLFPLLTHPSLLSDLAYGSKNAMFEMRETLNRIPGLTSFMALQSLCVLLNTGYATFTGTKLPRAYHFALIALAVCCVLRAWVWSERLALLEFILPALLVFFTLPGKPRHLWLSFAPLLGILGVFALFCAGEYFRSWQYYQYSSDDGLLSFAFTRLIGYYAAALNTGAALYSVFEPAYMPVATAAWFYKLPLFSILNITFAPSVGYDAQMLADFLQTHGTPEFNNTSGIFMPYCDFGAILGTVCWAVLGYISGRLYRGYMALRTAGLLLYPVWYIGILEILRVFYWGDSRFFPVLIAALILIVYMGKRRVI